MIEKDKLYETHYITHTIIMYYYYYYYYYYYIDSHIRYAANAPMPCSL